jgi:CRISPR/Cas system-associated exonuclease Cas4 (RecB family)
MSDIETEVVVDKVSNVAKNLLITAKVKKRKSVSRSSLGSIEKIKGAAAIQKAKTRQIQAVTKLEIDEIRKNIERYKLGMQDIADRQERMKNLYDKRIILAVRQLLHTTLKPKPIQPYEKINYQLARSNLVKEITSTHRDYYVKILKTIKADDDWTKATSQLED